MSGPHYQAASDLLDDWRDGVLGGTPPVLFPAGDGELSRIEIGPGMVTLFGGSPGQGKTALVMQLVCEALERTPTLRALVCNVEMPSSVLLDRQLARLSGVELTTIRHRRLGAEHAERIDTGMQALERFGDRLAFVRPPFDLANVAESADDFGADLIVLDYIQRIAAPSEHANKRGSVDASMSYLRQFADAGVAVLVVAALARSKDTLGRSSYAGADLSLASFRESSELEYGADDALIVVGDGEHADRVLLKHLKSRNGEARDIALTFDRPRQRFTADDAPEPEPTPKRPDGKLSKALMDLWGKTPPASEGDE